MKINVSKRQKQTSSLMCVCVRACFIYKYKGVLSVTWRQTLDHARGIPHFLPSSDEIARDTRNKQLLNTWNIYTRRKKKVFRVDEITFLVFFPDFSLVSKEVFCDAKGRRFPMWPRRSTGVTGRCIDWSIYSFIERLDWFCWTRRHYTEESETGWMRNYILFCYQPFFIYLKTK